MSENTNSAISDGTLQKAIQEAAYFAIDIDGADSIDPDSGIQKLVRLRDYLPLEAITGWGPEYERLRSVVDKAIGHVDGSSNGFESNQEMGEALFQALRRTHEFLAPAGYNDGN